MNIFALDNDPMLAAQWQHDRHVVKMTLETCQLLSTAVWHDPTIRGYWTETHGEFRPHIDNIDSGSVRLYKSISNPNHPVAMWARASLPNFVWTWIHGHALVSEYHRRFQKRHGCYSVIASFVPVIESIVRSKMWLVEREEYAPGKWNRTVRIQPAVLNLADGHDPFAVCMPDEYKVGLKGYEPCIKPTDAVASYRNLYLESKIFQDHVKWTRCDSLPAFITDHAAVVFEPNRVQKRIPELLKAHLQGLATTRVTRPVVTHPDLLKPTNPKAITRFGVSK